jgi:hypothetical protein
MGHPKAGGQLDVNSPQFRDGLSHCHRWLPTGAPASPAQQAAVTAHAVKFAECMRAHGVPDFPDPGVSPRGRQIARAGLFCPGAKRSPQSGQPAIR